MKIYSKRHPVRLATEKIDHYAKRFRWLCYDSMVEWKQMQLRRLLKELS